MLLIEHKMLHFVGALFVLVTQAIDRFETDHCGFANADARVDELLIDDRRFYDVVWAAQSVAVSPDHFPKRCHEPDPHEQKHGGYRDRHDGQGGVEKETVHVQVNVPVKCPAILYRSAASHLGDNLALGAAAICLAKVLVGLFVKMRR